MANTQIPRDAQGGPREPAEDIRARLGQRPRVDDQRAETPEGPRINRPLVGAERDRAMRGESLGKISHPQRRLDDPDKKPLQGGRPMRLKQMAAPGQWEGEDEGDMPGVRFGRPDPQDRRPTMPPRPDQEGGMPPPPSELRRRMGQPQATLTAPQEITNGASLMEGDRPLPRHSPRPVINEHKEIPLVPVFKHLRPHVGQVADGWVRLDLPSRAVPYTWSEVSVRPFEVPDFVALYDAISAEDSTMFYDAMQPCCSQDIRDLTGPDLRAMMYWWKLNSYNKAPWEIEWSSRYGNRNTLTIFSNTRLEEMVLNMSDEEFAEYRQMGICFPTVRDSEYMERLKPVGGQKWMQERLQYVWTDVTDPEDWYPSRRRALDAGGAELLLKIQEFRERIQHGVRESIEVVDAKFHPRRAVEALRLAADQTNRLIEFENPRLSPTVFTDYTERVLGLLEEAEEIEAALQTVAELEADGQDAQAREALSNILPRKETITLTINVMDFFSTI